MISDRSVEELTIDSLPDEVLDGDIRKFLTFNEHSSFFTVSKRFYHLLNNRSEVYLQHKLVSAVIDDQYAEVERLLTLHPELLKADYINNAKWLIQSRNAGQYFRLEHPLRIAARRFQCEMVDILLSHMSGLEYSAIVEREAAIFSEYHVVTATAEVRGKHCYPIIYPLFFKIILADNRATKEEWKFLEGKLDKFYQRLQRQNIDDTSPWFAVECLLLAAFELAINRRQEYEWSMVMNQYDFFYVRVIGYLQRLLSPSMQRVLMKGLYSANFHDDFMDMVSASVSSLVSSGGHFHELGKKSYITVSGRLDVLANTTRQILPLLQNIFIQRKGLIQDKFSRMIEGVNPDPEDLPPLPCLSCVIS